jgi:hypothetical protein
MAGLAGEPFPGGGHGYGTKVAPRRAASASQGRVNVQVLCDGPRHGGVSHAPLPSDGPGALTLGDPLACDTPLQLGQLGLAAHVHTTPAGSNSAIVGTLHDPLALVFSQGAQEGDEAAAYGRGEVQVWLVEHLDHGTPCVDALDNVHAIHHRPGSAVPFGHDEHITRAERVDGLLQLRPALDRLARCLLAVDFMAPLRAQGSDLQVQVLGARGDPRIAKAGESDSVGELRVDTRGVTPILNPSNTKMANARARASQLKATWSPWEGLPEQA